MQTDVNIVGLRRRTVWNPSTLRAYVEDICVRALDAPGPKIPVFYDGFVVAVVQTFRNRTGSLWWAESPIRWATIRNWDDVIKACCNGRRYAFHGSSGQPNTVTGWRDAWAAVGGAREAGTYTGAARTAKSFVATDAGALGIGPASVSPYERRLVAARCTHGGYTAGRTAASLLYDRVLAYEACDMPAATQRTMTNVVTAPRYTSDGGMQCIVTAQTATNATVSALSELTYVDQDGNSSVLPVTPTIGLKVSIAAASALFGAHIVAPFLAAGTGGAPWNIWLPLAAGDTGMRSITSYTWTANNTTTLAYVLIRPIVWIGSQPWATVDNSYSGSDMASKLDPLPVILDNAHLSLIMTRNAATGNSVSVELQYAWG